MNREKAIAGETSRREVLIVAGGLASSSRTTVAVTDPSRSNSFVASL